MFLDARRSEYLSIHRMIPLIYAPYLDAEAFRIYVLYAAIAGSEGHAEVSEGDICRFLGLEPDTLEQAHETLQSYGLIQLKAESAGDSGFMCTLLPPPPLSEEYIEDLGQRALPVDAGAVLPKPAVAKRLRKAAGVTPAKLISKFYRGINRPKIESDEREMAKAEVSDLRANYTLEQIDEAIQWTLANQDILLQPVESFAIIRDTIDQALAAQAHSETTLMQAQAEASVEEEAFRKQQQTLHEFRKTLSEEQLREIRQLALAEIDANETLVRELVTESFIRATEDAVILGGYMSDSFEPG